MANSNMKQTQQIKSSTGETTVTLCTFRIEAKPDRHTHVQLSCLLPADVSRYMPPPMVQYAKLEKESCRFLVKKMKMMLKDRRLPCFKLDQRGHLFFKDRQRLTGDMCHRINPKKVDGWEPCKPDAFYWQERDENIKTTTKGKYNVSIYLILFYSNY